MFLTLAVPAGVNETPADKKNRANKANAGGQKAKVPGTALNERAMLVNLSIGYWEGRKKDKEKTKEVVTEEKAAFDAGAWWTRIVPPSATKPVINARLNARYTHQAMTLPWRDDGFRVLPAAMFLKYTEAMRKAEAAFRTEVNKFLAAYPEHVVAAEKRLGGLFHADQFPLASELADKFPWSLGFVPLPTAGDFRVDLGAENTKAVQKSIQEGADNGMKEAMGDLWNRLYAAVSKIAERLNDPDGVFRDSLIGNVAELAELLPAMNVTGDKDLEAARQAVIAKLANKEPEVLRTNKPARADAAKAANDILEQMKAFMPKS